MTPIPTSLGVMQSNVAASTKLFIESHLKLPPPCGCFVFHLKLLFCQSAASATGSLHSPLQAKFDTLVSDHQRSLDDLKAVMSGDPAAAAGQEQDAQELRAALEALKLEHQLETENLKAKHKIEAAVLTKEREDLSGRLQELREQLAEGGQPRRTEADGRGSSGSKQALEETADKLQRAEQRLAEMEQQKAEFQERLELSEKKMTDYQALQKAQGESREEIQELEEKLRVTANQLQALQAGRYTSNDTANVR